MYNFAQQTAKETKRISYSVHIMYGKQINNTIKGCVDFLMYTI